jgi:anhydro-N-acetylmuramic acid kinase
MFYDDGGAWALWEIPDESLVSEMMDHPYFALKPPKSTGCEVFGKTYTMKFVAMAKECGINDDDIVATATAFTARTIVEGYKRFVFPMCRIDEVIVSGGGCA